VNTTANLKKKIVGALLSGAFGLAAAVFGAATAHADGAHRWCPGDPKNMPFVVNDQLDWDWGICHTWYSTNYGGGNVTIAGHPASIWDGANPPPDSIEPRACPPVAFMCP
jgi:hypothetical protein